MKRPISLVLYVLLLAAMLLSACTSTPKAKVRIAMDATWPPFESVDEATKQIVGFDADLIKAIAAKEGLDIELVNVAWDPLLAGMAQCQYDAAISAMTITEERMKEFNFSDPYYAAGQIVTVRSDDTTITGKEALSGKKVGVQLGTTGDIEAQKISGAQVKNYDDVGMAFLDLMNGQVDAVITDNPLAWNYIRENAGKLKTAGEVFTDEFYGIAVCKTNTDLLSKLNSGLAKVKDEGLIDQLAKKWIEGQ